MTPVRRATIALITGILSVSGLVMTASPADAVRDTNWPTLRDTNWPT